MPVCTYVTAGVLYACTSFAVFGEVMSVERIVALLERFFGDDIDFQYLCTPEFR